MRLTSGESPSTSGGFEGSRGCGGYGAGVMVLGGVMGLRGQAVAATAMVTEQTAVGADILVDVQLAEVCSPSLRCFETQLTYRRRVTR